MQGFQRSQLSVCLGLNAILMTLMLPGGPVEIRNFSAYSTTTLTLYKLFLSALVTGTLLTIALCSKQYQGAGAGSIISGICYLSVHAVGLLAIFLFSPNPATAILLTLELVACIAAISLIFLGKKLLHYEKSYAGAQNTLSAFQWLIVIALANCLVIFTSYLGMAPD